MAAGTVCSTNSDSRAVPEAAFSAAATRNPISADSRPPKAPVRGSDAPVCGRHRPWPSRCWTVTRRYGLTGANAFSSKSSLQRNVPPSVRVSLCTRREKVCHPLPASMLDGSPSTAYLKGSRSSD
ncbi:hypothetical protein [Streptomyces sp. enrichment culture]|uniref:hypothetical protein n=1 Tax=Streptomyces sp. enrichment culture TaxID=1795815 RepID=UPI003F57B5CC